MTGATRATTRNSRGRARRQQLVNHAARLIAERGLGHVRPADITQAAGNSPGLFYWYFRDMDDLVGQLVVEARRTLRRAYAASVEGLRDPLEQLYAACRETIRLGATNEMLRVLAWSDDLRLNGAYAEENQRTVQVMIDDAIKVLTEGQVQGSIRRDLTALHLAYCVRAVVHYNMTSYHRGLVLGSVDEMADAIAGFVVRAVCTDLSQAEAIESRWRQAARNAAAPSQTPPT
jgi:AcrR family transcriptional regulator